MDHEKFVNELGNEYEKKNYEIVASNHKYPGIFTESNETLGKVDLLLLENDVPDSYKIVQTFVSESLNSRTIESHLNRTDEQAERAQEYFNSNCYGEFDSETIVGTSGDLNTVRELFENTVGEVFSWNQALSAVSNKGRLGNLRDTDYLLIDHEVSREENEEYFRLSRELDGVVDILLENNTYP